MADTRIQPGIQDAAAILNDLQGTSLVRAKEQLPSLSNGMISQADIQAFTQTVKKNQNLYMDGQGNTRIINRQTLAQLEKLASNKSLINGLSGLSLDKGDPSLYLSINDTELMKKTEGGGLLERLISVEDLAKKGRQNLYAAIDPEGARQNPNGTISDQQLEAAAKVKNRDWVPRNGMNSIELKVDRDKTFNGTGWTVDPLPNGEAIGASANPSGQPTTEDVDANNLAGLFTGASAAALVSGALAWLEHQWGPELLPARFKWPIIAGAGLLSAIAGFFGGREWFRLKPNNSGG